jgi:hypothetical protein
LVLEKPELWKGIAPGPMKNGMTRMKVFYRRVELIAQQCKKIESSADAFPDKWIENYPCPFPKIQFSQ